METEIRKDYFLNKYVIITPDRAKRPHVVIAKDSNKKRVKCPFCFTGIEKKLLIKHYQFPNNQVSVIKNKYPVLTLDNLKSYGKHEIIIETPKHGTELSQLPLKNFVDLLKVFQDRTLALSKIKGIDYILIFKNQGNRAGASLDHSHCQVFASKLLPPDLEEEFQAMDKYQRKNKSCPYCDIIKKEEKSPRRIYSDRYMVAFAPYASAFHYETWIFPRRRLDNITNLSEEELISLAKVLKKVLTKIYKLGLSYNFFLHQVVSKRNQHFYLKIQPRDSVWGGVELGSGVIVNSMSPEKAAAYLR
ncbi:MAG: DUF4931 domain-containing protein [Patescibacteria group bacterium]|nr:DUF4931 domain-containing protein [Patescibacteria group bacterium]